MIGQVLGHYHVVSKIGEGGMGVVYRAHDEVLHRDVALKVVTRAAGLDQSASQNLLREARASSALSHPNICTIHEVGEADGELYIVMELVEGKPLRSLIGDIGLPVESVLRYGAQMANALGRAHDRGIVHRDLKSSNVVITSEGPVKVLDFGLAKRVEGAMFDGSTRSFESIQDASTVSGTLPYMAPEVLRGEGADYRSDLWALGVVLYEAASGRLPFEGRTSFEISSAILREMPKPLGPPVPPGLWGTIQRCMTKEATQRYQRAGEVQAALEALLSAGIVSRDPTADPGPPRTTILHGVRHIQVKKEIFFCWWEPQKEHSSCDRTFNVPAGMLAVPIFTGTRFTPWRTTTAWGNTAYGRQRRVIGAHSCVPATISGKAGPIRRRLRFDFPPIPAFP